MNVWFDGSMYEAEWGIYTCSGTTRLRAVWNVVVFRFFRRWDRLINRLWAW